MRSACAVALIVFCAAAAARTPPDAAALREALAVAERVAQRVGDAAGAARVLEEAGVDLWLRGAPPPAAQRRAIAAALAAYAGYLARLDGRFEDAAVAYKRAIEIDPGLPQAYLGLGDLYGARHARGGAARDREIQVKAYRRYIERLLAAPAPPPPRVWRVLYPQAGDPCGLLAAWDLGDLAALARLLDAAGPAEAVGADTAELAAAAGATPSLALLLRETGGRLERRRLDLDGDGGADWWLTGRDAEGCLRMAVYRDDGEAGRTLLAGPVFDAYFEGRRACAAPPPAWLRWDGALWLLEWAVPEEDEGAVGLLRFDGAALEPACRCRPVDTALECRTLP
ncbi:MAG: hypothetical protein KatS3mg121_1046 [Gammaproteobacteria bacterium]|nr:MAG: hypothetical protein KatS3mg121_1046 [Gammaproteobacteria bacterium]